VTTDDDGKTTGTQQADDDADQLDDELLAQVEAEMQQLQAELDSAAPQPAEELQGPDRYIATLEDEVMQLTALMQDRDAAVEASEARAEQARAEVEKAKVRIKREAETLARRQKHKLLLEFLEVLDDLERAVEAASNMDHNPEVVAGVQMVTRRFITTFNQLGVRQQEAMGQPFDPESHEAVSVMPVSDTAQDGVVMAVTRQGYTAGDGVLRPARVVIGRASG